jgi:hypothetical protein
MMKARTLLSGLCACVLLAALPPYAFAQAAPRYFADANHPAGAPDPEKLDTIWSVDPISDQVSIRIPFTTTPQGGRGPKLPFALLYNSASTITLQGAGAFGVGFGSSVDLFFWSDKPAVAPASIPGPTGPWTTTGPYFYSSSNNIEVADGQHGC